MDHLHADNPVHVLQANMQGGLRSGEVGVVAARAGIGKTACLVQFGLDALLREKRVLHMQLAGEDLDGVKLWYDTVLDDMARAHGLDDGADLRQQLEARRIIHLRGDAPFHAEGFADTLALYASNLGFDPEVILIDGFDWSGPLARTAACLGALKIVARSHGAQIWMTARSHREAAPTHESGVPAPADRYYDVLDAVILLMPRRDGRVALSLLKHGNEDVDSVAPLVLHPHTMRLVREGTPRVERIPPELCTLLSGAARGAEAAFGACAERWGIAEVNFTFDGKPVARDRGLRVLSPEQLQRGARRARQIRAESNRALPDTPLIDKVLLSLWHQVETAGQVFVVGIIQSDGSVKGGTGWAADIARVQHKSVHVYDQERQGWFTRTEATEANDGSDAWVPCDPPRIRSSRFAGTGSRQLSDPGRAAIEALFERSFGTPRH